MFVAGEARNKHPTFPIFLRRYRNYFFWLKTGAFMLLELFQNPQPFVA